MIYAYIKIRLIICNFLSFLKELFFSFLCAMHLCLLYKACPFHFRGGTNWITRREREKIDWIIQGDPNVGEKIPFFLYVGLSLQLEGPTVPFGLLGYVVGTANPINKWSPHWFYGKSIWWMRVWKHVYFFLFYGWFNFYLFIYLIFF